MDEIGIRDIDAQYRAVVRKRLDGALIEAGDDMAALAILREIRQQTLKGMTWNESGETQYLDHIVVENQAWVERPGGQREKEKDEGAWSHYLMMGLSLLVLLWIGSRLWLRPHTAVLQDEVGQINTISVVDQLGMGGENRLAFNFDDTSNLGAEIDVKCFLVTP